MISRVSSLTALVAICLVAASAGARSVKPARATGIGEAVKEEVKATPARSQMKAPPSDPRLLPHRNIPVIDGAVSPDRIPDATAYAMFLGMLPPSAGDAAANSRRKAYLRHVLQLGAAENPKSSQSAERCAKRPSDEDVATAAQVLEPHAREMASFHDDARARRVLAGTTDSRHAAIATNLRRALERDQRPIAAMIRRYITGPFKSRIKVFSPGAVS